MFSVVAGFLLVIILISIIHTQANAFHEQGPAHPESVEIYDTAYIAMQFSETDNATHKISFDEPISGLEALLLTGLDVVTKDYGWGIAICSIEGIGCPEENCLECSSNFWNYYYWDGDVWIPSPEAATDTEVYNGDVEGWRWGEWEQGNLLPAPHLVAAADAITWLNTQQNTVTGGYGSMSSSVEVLLSIGANNLAADEWRQKSYTKSLGEYIRVNSTSYARKTAAEAGKLSVGISATQMCWPPLTSQPLDYITPETGVFSEHTGFNAWGILGSLAISQTVPAGAIDQLTNSVFPKGAWEWNNGFGTDTNTTALVVQTLIASGVPTDSVLISNALNYLNYAQNTDGGFPYDPDSPYSTDSDANSTAYAIQAIRAAGQDPITGTWVISATNPISYLLTLQLEDGSFEWVSGGGSNLLATAQAVTALLGESYPLSTREVQVCPATYLPISLRAPED
jgi:hypothetical protein